MYKVSSAFRYEVLLGSLQAKRCHRPTHSHYKTGSLHIM